MAKKERTEVCEMLGALLADENFFILDQRLTSPNFFTIMNMRYQKANYTSLLAYLLNPHESHGLSDKFLKYFLLNSFKANPLKSKRPEKAALSPIPYETVNKSLLRWDKLDILSADLRETMVITNYPLGDEGRTVDLCIWNEAYGIVVYVENFICVRQGWRRYHQKGVLKKKSHSREYLLDLYKQWASEESGNNYEILPVFISTGDFIPDEPYFTRVMNYDWMVNVLELLNKRPTVSTHAQILIYDFIEELKKENSRKLDPELHKLFNLIGDMYGPVICRLYDHVSGCNGCDSENELIIAYHDVYRRHQVTIEQLWLYIDSMEYKILDEIKEQINDLAYDENMILEQTSSMITGKASSWNRINPVDEQDNLEKHNNEPIIEVFFSASIGTCGIFVYQEPALGKIKKIWMHAQDLAEEMEIELSPKKPGSRNFHLAKIQYDRFTPLDIARDFIRFYKLTDMIIKEISP
ncbi:MAG: PD-(D/E)XK nuclease family protein [Deltaproteobacteria bacterium]|jgi:hypothetical protein|nr:PD-(D/E)XK nuclease family protein [Deltaproteobacteria bacterium]